MAFVKKTWKDRIAEFPTRRRLTKSNGDSELVTVSREEGTLSQEGDAFSAENMNDLENRIDAEFTAVNGNLSRYNLETDCLDIYSNGKVIGSIPCNFQVYKFANTKGSDWVCYNMSVFTDGNNITFKPVNLTSGGGWSAKYSRKITIKNGAQLYYSVGNNNLFWSGNLQYSADGTNWTSIKVFASGTGDTGSAALSSGDYYFMFSGYSNTNPTDAVFPTLEIK